jgi:hypothetical protein
MEQGLLIFALASYFAYIRRRRIQQANLLYINQPQPPPGAYYPPPQGGPGYAPGYGGQGQPQYPPQVHNTGHSSYDAEATYAPVRFLPSPVTFHHEAHRLFSLQVPLPACTAMVPTSLLRTMGRRVVLHRRTMAKGHIEAKSVAADPMYYSGLCSYVEFCDAIVYTRGYTREPMNGTTCARPRGRWDTKLASSPLI